MLVSGNDFYCGNASGSPCQFALKNQIPSAYVHPSTKQCNYSVDLSNYAQISQIPSSLRGDYGSPLEMGKYIDFHESGSSSDYDGRLYIDSGNLYFSSSSSSGQVAYKSDIPSGGNLKAYFGSGRMTASKSRADGGHGTLNVSFDGFSSVIGAMCGGFIYESYKHAGYWPITFYTKSFTANSAAFEYGHLCTGDYYEPTTYYSFIVLGY